MRHGRNLFIGVFCFLACSCNGTSVSEQDSNRQVPSVVPTVAPVPVPVRPPTPSPVSTLSPSPSPSPSVTTLSQGSCNDPQNWALCDSVRALQAYATLSGTAQDGRECGAVFSSILTESITSALQTEVKQCTQNYQRAVVAVILD